LVGRHEGHPACKNVWVLVCGENFTAPLIVLAVTATSIILSSNKIQNEDILVLAYPGCPGKWPFNERWSIVVIRKI